LKFVKELYGHIKVARLFYDNLNKTIQDGMGFKQNSYDPCVYNKEAVEGMVMIRVHVDDLQISSKSKEQYYLGMILIYQPEEKIIALNMKNYVKGIIEEFEQANLDDTVKQVKTPASNNLFRVRKENEASDLMQDKSSIFHPTTAKLLFLATRST
jgi:hypothetical protein